jgi:hypothetical protein
MKNDKYTFDLLKQAAWVVNRAREREREREREKALLLEERENASLFCPPPAFITMHSYKIWTKNLATTKITKETTNKCRHKTDTFVASMLLNILSRIHNDLMHDRKVEDF